MLLSATCIPKYSRCLALRRSVGPLKEVLPANIDNVLYVVYDFETTQNKMYSDTAKADVPNRVCVNRFVRVVRTRKKVV